MAAAAGAPGSGEGGEAEPDSEPISGEGRPGADAEAAVEPNRISEDLGWDPADGSAADDREPGLRLPEDEVVPEYTGPEVTSRDTGAQGPGPDTVEAAPEPWPLAQNTEASEVDTGDKGMGESMQLGEALTSPLVPHHGGLGPVPMEIPSVLMELEGRDECEAIGEITSSEAEHPPPVPVILEPASSPQPQVLTEQLESGSEPMDEEVQEMQGADHQEVLQESVPDLEVLYIQETAPVEVLHIQDSAPVELLRIQELTAGVVSQVQEPSLAEVMYTQEPISDIVSQVETVPLEGPHIQDPVTNVMFEVQEPTIEVVQEPALDVVPLMNLLGEGQEPIPEVIMQEPVPEVVPLIEDLLCTVQESVPLVTVQEPVLEIVPLTGDSLCKAEEPVLEMTVQDPIPDVVMHMEDLLQEPVAEVLQPMQDSLCEVQEPVPEGMVQDPVPEVFPLMENSLCEMQEPDPEVIVQEPVPEIALVMEDSLHEAQKLVPEVFQLVENSVNEVQEPLPEMFQLTEDSLHEAQEPVSKVFRLMEDSPSKLLESVPELVPAMVAEPEAMKHLQDKVSLEHTLEQETVLESIVLLSDPVPDITEVETVVKTVETAVDSIHEYCKESTDPLDSDDEFMPTPFHNKIQHELDTVSTEKQVLALGVAEINQGSHPVSEQCNELGVEVKLSLHPVLKQLDVGPKNEDLSSVFPFVSHTTQFQALPSPGETSVQLISKINYDSAPGNCLSPSELAQEDAASPLASERTTLEKELDSQSIHMETEPRLENTSESAKIVSFAPDVEYDPFYRDTEMDQISVAKTDAFPNSLSNDTVLGQLEAPMVSPNSAQLKDNNELCCLEEPKPPSINSSIDACLDNPDKCQGTLPTTEQLITGGIDGLIPGSEVQVTLDHLIQDALVVSFRHGDRIFSGVLMDLSKRFGPHGIPVTVHPKREYKNKPEEPIQPQSTSFQEDTSLKNENGAVPMDVSPIQSNEPCGVHNLWTSKPPPLFHEGAPYPPPLFIRDTYNQSIPQPPPRKIKRLKKKIYREEPTSIMNAIKLRPRQVLCDKCKNVVADKKEVRKTGNDSFKLEEGKRRRHESVTTVNKKLKTDHKVNGKSQSDSHKRNSVSKVTTLGHGRGKVIKVASQTNASKAHLHTKKVLQSKNMDHAKAREVLKMAKVKARKKQKDASSSKNAHGKVHIARRLQNSSSGTLPPRLRIKPQRYRNEENDSSLKIGLESLRSSKMGIKPQTRYTATRSAGEAPSEITTPSNGPEEVSSDIQNTSVCAQPGEQDEQQALSKRGSKSNITVYMTLNQKKADSSSASVCSSDSTDDLKSIHSECSSTENFDFPPGSMHAPSSSSSSSSKEEKKLSNPLKIKVFSKNVSKCMTPDGRTICVGDIVWAKIYGFPWWPARILTITISRKDNGLLVRQEARISWFGSPTTSFLALSQLSPFLENFQSRFNKKRKGLYRKAITEAAKAAKQLTPEVRALLTQFET
ncbi:PWWP domain-containing protein 2A [Mixophyes fleayi]|uniref:PWWP domain-containing protein 2A n=1 Tax=Mixophyes fleayi TaxID=3061075 RepID=UPI003F4DF456